jgi:hypothetical protein
MVINKTVVESVGYCDFLAVQRISSRLRLDQILSADPLQPQYTPIKLQMMVGAEHKHGIASSSATTLR